MGYLVGMLIWVICSLVVMLCCDLICLVGLSWIGYVDWLLLLFCYLMIILLVDFGLLGLV